MRPRFLPVLIASAAGLAVIKIAGLAMQGGYIITPDRAAFARALVDPRQPQEWAQGDVTGTTPAKKTEAGAEAPKTTESTQPLPPKAISGAERDIYEQLGQRRKELDEKARELELREHLLKSAEKIAAEQIEEFKGGQALQQGSVAPQPVSPELKALAGIYEAMKPRDAARVFDKMDTMRLLPLARQMNPKKLAEVMAAMTPEAAEKLTLQMLGPKISGQPGAADLPLVNELPRIRSAPKS